MQDHDEDAADDLRDAEPVDLDELSSDDPILGRIANARKRYGTGGAALAGGMFGLAEVLGMVKDDRPVAVAEAPGEPGDVDRDGIRVDLDGSAAVHAPALAQRAILDTKSRRRRRR